MSNTDKKARFSFKLESAVRDLTPPGSPYTFDYHGPHNVRVVVRAPSDEEREKGHKQENAFCTASCTYPISHRNREIFDQIIEDRIIPTGGKLGSGLLKYRGPEGRSIRIPNLSEFPQSFRSFIEAVSDELWDFTRRTVATLRWRGNIEFGSHNPFSSRGVTWSTDGEFWHPAPLDLRMRIEARYPLKASAQVLSDVARIVGEGGNEPLHHNLLREAWQQRHTNPRSALVIGMGAAEIAVKYYIGSLVPEAEWLAFNLPTPPLNKMLVEYLPKLKARCSFDGKVKPPPAPVLERLKEGVSIRNGVIHAGAPSPSTDKIEEILSAVRELLWLLDFYSGFPWALDFLDTETRSELSEAVKPPSPPPPS